MSAESRNHRIPQILAFVLNLHAESLHCVWLRALASCCARQDSARVHSFRCQHVNEGS